MGARNDRRAWQQPGLAHWSRRRFGALCSGLLLVAFGGTSLTTRPVEVPAIETRVAGAVVTRSPGFEVAPHGDLVVARVSATRCGRRAEGTGVLVADGVMVTAAHVVGDARIVRVDHNGVTVSAKVAGVVIDGRDLALLSVDGVVDGPLATAPDPVEGDAVTIVGYHLGGPRVASAGPLVPLSPVVAGAVRGDVIGVHAPGVAPGASGGPALDAAGRLVGITVAVETASGTALVMPIDSVHELAGEGVVAGACPVAA